MKFTRIALAVALAGISFGAQATNGYFSHGYGLKAKGMAGVSSANTEDAFFGANNPATAAFVGDRLDLGVDLFNPVREATNTGANKNASGESNQNYFPAPEFGYNMMLSPKMSLGISVYGNGGMNTDFSPNPATGKNLFGGNGNIGVDMMQLLIAPTVAYKIAANHSVGLSPLLAYQQFKAEGLSSIPAFMSIAPQALTNVGYDKSAGYGVRLGYFGKLTPGFSFGASYASRMEMDKFDRYRGLFAGQGEFDIPENYQAGVSWQATPSFRLAVDYQRINFSDIVSVGNPVMPNFLGSQLGKNDGAGFGWDDVEVWKFGVEYKLNKQLTVRAGYSENNNPINEADPREVMFNILAPAVIEKHATVGFTYALASGNEVTMAYTHAFENSLTANRIGAFGGGNDTISMYQRALGVQYSWKM